MNKIKFRVKVIEYAPDDVELRLLYPWYKSSSSGGLVMHIWNGMMPDYPITYTGIGWIYEPTRKTNIHNTEMMACEMLDQANTLAEEYFTIQDERKAKIKAEKTARRSARTIKPEDCA